jgi:hypothetical protein
MNESCEKEQGQKQTLMEVFARLEDKCLILREVAGLTKNLYEKLNRTEDHPKCQEGGINKEPILERNIVELFDFIADKIEVQTNVIRNNTTESIQMIE